MSRRCFWLFMVVGGLLVLNGFSAVARFQVNGLFGDQWSFYQPMFEGAGWWELFTWQHGPHRQGLAFVLTAMVQEWSGWDVRVESAWIFGQLVLATGLALMLKWRLVGRIRFYDIWILVACLSLISYETIILVPNASHSVFPLLGLMGVANIWPKTMTLTRGLGLGLLAFIMMFTGFGLFGAGMITLLLGLTVGLSWGDPDRSRRWGAILGVVLSGLGWTIFMQGYVFLPASEGYHFPHLPVSDYLRFVTLMLAGRMGFDGTSLGAYIFGGMAIVASLTGVVIAVRRLRRSAPDRVAMVGLLLVGASLAFAGFTAVGRVHLGVDGGMVSRYMPLLFPLWMGLDLLASRLKMTRVRVGVTVFASLMAVGPWLYVVGRPSGDWVGTVGLRDGDLTNVRSFQAGKLAWIDAVAQQGDWRIAEQIAPKGVFPFTEFLNLDAKLAALQNEQLSFFAESDQPMAWLSWMPDRSVQWLRPASGSATRTAAPVARVLVRARQSRFLNVRISQAGAAVQPVRFSWSDRVGTIPASALDSGISISVERGDQVLELIATTAGEDRSMRVALPTLSEAPEFVEWNWSGSDWGQLRRLEITRGFHGWEEEGAFGWTGDDLAAEVAATRPSYVNVRVDSRFDPVDRGLISIQCGDSTWEIDLATAQQGISLVVPPDGISRAVHICNSAGATSPEAAGLWSDSRSLALRLTRLSIDADARYGVLKTVNANDSAKSP